MPLIQFSPETLKIDGPRLTVVVSPPTMALEAGPMGAIALSARLNALIDTGARYTMVSPPVIEAFRLQTAGATTVTTPTGSADLPVFRMRIALLPGHEYETSVIAAPPAGEDLQCLIGRDLLAKMVLTYDGPANRFSLSF